MELNKIIEEQKSALKRKLEFLDTINVEQLIKQKDEHLAKIAEIDKQIAEFYNELGINKVQSATPAVKTQGKRKNMSSETSKQNILAVLSKKPTGVSQSVLSKESGVNYATVINFLKSNTDLVRVEGVGRNKLFFVK